MSGTAVSATPATAHPLAHARSLLFVPANRPERLAKALASGADGVIVDLEDAVAPADKPAARGQLREAFAQVQGTQRRRVLVRVNASATPWHAEDAALVHTLAATGLGGVVLPKAETAAQLQGLALAVGPFGALLPLVESVAGLDALAALAAAPQVLRLVFGNLDFQLDAGLACATDEAELAPVRLAVVLASRRAHLPPPLDGVTPDIHDAPRLASDAARARRGGFGGKLCIHPSQVAAVNGAFTPSAAERDWAHRVVDGFAAHHGGVFMLDGRMIDAPVVYLAQRLLAHGQPPG